MAQYTALDATKKSINSQMSDLKKDIIAEMQAQSLREVTYDDIRCCYSVYTKQVFSPDALKSADEDTYNKYLVTTESSRFSCQHVKK